MLALRSTTVAASVARSMSLRTISLRWLRSSPLNARARAWSTKVWRSLPGRLSCVGWPLRLLLRICGLANLPSLLPGWIRGRDIWSWIAVTSMTSAVRSALGHSEIPRVVSPDGRARWLVWRLVQAPDRLCTATRARRAERNPESPQDRRQYLPGPDRPSPGVPRSHRPGSFESPVAMPSTSRRDRPVVRQPE